MQFNMFKNIAKGLMLEANFGIEREGLRVTNFGVLSKKNHPEVFGNKKENPYITADFSESQLELITPIFHYTNEAINFLESLYNIAVLELQNELIWPQSMPSRIISEEDILGAHFSSYSEEKYREYLLKKYGGKKQLISGVHVNFSLSSNLIDILYARTNKQSSYTEFKNNLYLKLARNYLRYHWILVYFFCATNVMHKTYRNQCIEKLNEISSETFSNKSTISFRNSLCGYSNNEYLKLDYASLNNYVKSITNFIKQDKIRDIRELYTQIRLKNKESVYSTEKLLKTGIEYIEIRTLDINPFVKGGLALSDLNFIHLFLLYCLEKEESIYDDWQVESELNSRKASLRGRDINVILFKNGKRTSLHDWGKEIISELLAMNQHYNLHFYEILKEKERMLNGEVATYSGRLFNLCQKDGYIKTHLDLARTYKEVAFSERFSLEPYTDMELSTQILLKESIKRGINFNVIDRKENFVKLSKNNNSQYIKQATKTSKDAYVSVLIMENKSLTKYVLRENNISVPGGMEFSDIKLAKENILQFVNIPVVIKPKATNFGLGISIFPHGTTVENLLRALEIAFRADGSVLIENFVEGEEYRFLIIDDETVGVLHRVAGNVIGDGVKTISELIVLKNRNPLRGIGYKTPLEKIIIDDTMKLFLAERKLTLDYVVPEGDVLYLRNNSNISTGGDSIDVTEQIPSAFKELAVKAAQVVGAKICGVDMIIANLKSNKPKAAIIELNFNPAIHIHCYPYQGKERNIAKNILQLLGY